MKQTWLVAAMMLTGTVAHTQECRPGGQILTVYTLSGKTSVPNEVQARARYMASKVLAGAGVTVKWVKGQRSNDSEQSFCGDRLTIAFDATAAAGFAPQALAYASLNAGSATEIHIFYDRVSAFPDHSRMPEYLGHVLAHEIAHVLEGVARHSNTGVMKARWDDADCTKLTTKPLPFAAEDIELIRSHFGTLDLQTAKTALLATNKSKK